MKVYFKSTENKNEFFTKELMEFQSNETFKIIMDGGESKICKCDELKDYAFSKEMDVLIVNWNVSPKIVKVLNMQKFLYEQKKAKKDQEKKQKASAQKLKEIKFHMNIAENDLNTKVSHAKEFLEENCKVKVVLELRGRENGMKELAKETFNKIVENFNGYQIDQIKFQDNSIFTFITK